jgi:hypothetical protein
MSWVFENIREIFYTLATASIISGFIWLVIWLKIKPMIPSNFYTTEKTHEKFVSHKGLDQKFETITLQFQNVKEQNNNLKEAMLNYINRLNNEIENLRRDIKDVMNHKSRE